MKRKAGVIALILIIFAAFFVCSCAETITWQLNDNITAKLKKGILTVSGYGAVEGEFIPEGGYGYFVYPWSSYRSEITKVIIGKGITKIGQESFNDCQITAVIISDTVTVIDNLAFAGNQLANVSVPDSVTAIGETAFYGNLLTSVAISGNVISIGAGAFANNPITEFTIAQENPNYISRNGFLLSKDGTELIDYYNIEKAAVIPDSVNVIGVNAFRSREIAKVTIPDSVKIIGDGAFSNNNLTEITIPGSVTSIGEFSFSNNKLTYVIIPSSVTSIGENAFFNNLLAGAVLSNNLKTIEKGVFWNNRLTSINIPSGVTVINEYAFQDNQIKSVIIPGNVTEIKRYAFARNPLTSVSLGTDVDLEDFAIDENFNVVYYIENKLAGTYTLGGGSWFKMSKNFTRTLELKDPVMNGQDVVNLQQRLLSLGYNAVGEADGYYGHATESAIRKLQAATGFSPDGKVNIFLWNYIFDDDNMEKIMGLE